MHGITRRKFVEASVMGAIAFSFSGLLSACSNNQERLSQVDQVVVSMPTSSEPAAGFDPLVAWGCGEHVHEPLIQSTLVTTDANLGFKCDLATSYSCENNGMTWVFKIRDDVFFSDGEPLTASDVAFTLNSIANSDASECDLSMVEEVCATDKTTVVIRMNKPFNALLYTLAVIGIVPEHAYGKTYGANPVGSGRYLLEQWDPGQQVILRANPSYYGKEPQIKRVVVVFMEEDASLAAARSGQVDVAYTSATFANNQLNGYRLLQCSSVDSRGISFPVVAAGGIKTDSAQRYVVGNDVTCNLALRQAINWGINREAFIKYVLNGYGTPAYSVADGMPWSSSDMKCKTDLAQAVSLLDDAGWKQGSDGIREHKGVRASFDLYYPSNDTVRQAMASEFANQMKDLGIEVSIKGVSWDDLYSHQFSDPVLWGWGANSPIETYSLYHSDSKSNYASYESAASDSYMDEALKCSQIEDSYELWQKAHWDGAQGFAPRGEAPWVWLVNVEHLYFVRQGLSVSKQKPHPHGHGWSLVNNIDRWSWE